VDFGVFVAVFGTDSSLFSSSENYFSMEESSCKDQDRVVKATAYDAKSYTGRIACATQKTDP
jgi:hypothetical protein